MTIGANYAALMDLITNPTMAGEALSALHDTNEVTLTNSVAPDQSQKGPLDTARYCRGFHINATGLLYVIFPGSTTAVKLSVKDGSYYPYSVKIFRNTNTTITAADIILMR